MRTNRHLQSLPLSLTLALVVSLAPGCSQSETSVPAEKPIATPEGSSAGSEPTTAIDTIDAFIATQKIDKSNPRWKTSLSKPPQASFDSDKRYFWLLDTSVGAIKIEFMPEVAPMHVSSTIYLSRLGFYDGVAFHRVIPGFMAQGGDPLGNGRGGPGYTYGGEFDKRVKHDRPGLLSMANAGPGTDGSQFFITFVPTPHLNGKHTIFGKVVEGMGTVKELEKHRLPSSNPRAEPLVIEHARIEVE